MPTLPGAERAVIPPEKLRDYALSPDHEEGRNKARVFRSALGLGQEDWEYLGERIYARLIDSEVTAVQAGRYGERYEVPMLIEGLNGETHEIVTGWIVDSKEADPRLTTVYVNVP